MCTFCEKRLYKNDRCDLDFQNCSAASNWSSEKLSRQKNTLYFFMKIGNTKTPVVTWFFQNLMMSRIDVLFMRNDNTKRSLWSGFLKFNEDAKLVDRNKKSSEKYCALLWKTEIQEHPLWTGISKLHEDDSAKSTSTEQYNFECIWLKTAIQKLSLWPGFQIFMETSNRSSEKVSCKKNIISF